jgi:hypothetical protein
VMSLWPDGRQSKLGQLIEATSSASVAFSDDLFIVGGCAKYAKETFAVFALDVADQTQTSP